MLGNGLAIGMNDRSRRSNAVRLTRNAIADRLTFFRSAARGLHVPADLTREPHEARGAEAPGQQTAASRLLRRVRCDVPGRCSLKRVVHPGVFRRSESSSNEQVDRKDPDERTQECAKLPSKSSTADQTSLRTRMVGARGVGGRRYE